MLCHTNHFLSPAGERGQLALAPSLSSVPRLTRARALINNHDKIGVVELERILRDESDGLLSICRRPDPSLPAEARIESVASVIMELTAGRMHVAPDVPSLAEYQTVTLAEAVPGIFYVFCGVLYPLSILPVFLQDVGKAIPLTYWFDLSRRRLLPASLMSGVPTGLSGFDNLTILGFLALSSVVFFGLSLGVFKLGEYLARKAGKIDMTTSY